MKNSTKIAIGIGSALGVGLAVGTLFNGLNNLVSRRDDPIFRRMAGRNPIEESFSDSQRERLHEAREWLLSQDLEEVTITSHDGLKLKGHLLTCENAKRTELLMHGWREPWQADMGMMTRYQHNHNCNVLIIEQRGHGESEGEYIGFGVLERYDCKAWCEYICQRFGEDLPLYLGGVSMGASTALMAAALDLPKNVKGIIADSGFTSPRAIVADVLSKKAHLPENLVGVLDLFNRVKAGYSYSEYSTLEALEQNTLPILFVHGDEDKFVPLAMTLENYLACKAPRDLLIVEGAEHGAGYLVDPEAYEAALQRLFARCEG